MISGWEIYLVMQLDTVRTVFFILGGIGALASCFFGFFAFVDDEDQPAILAKKTGIIAVPVLIAAALIPSSRTAAAMIIIPAVANNETIQQEANDLYQLAKDGFRRLVTQEEKTNAPKQ